MTGNRRAAHRRGRDVRRCPTGADDEIDDRAPVGSGVLVCLTNDARAWRRCCISRGPIRKASPARPQTQPARFADTGLALLFEQAGRLGVASGALQGAAGRRRHGARRRAGSDKVAKRNLLAARSALWRRGVFLDGEEVGGTQGAPRDADRGERAADRGARRRTTASGRGLET